MAKLHHYYIGTNVDASKVESDAYKRSQDKRSPESSLIHYHPHSEACMFNKKVQQDPVQGHKVVLVEEDE